MNKNLTEILCLIDASSSMSKLTDETIIGINNFINEQKNQPGDARISIYFFHTKVSVIYDGVDIKSVSPIDKTLYKADGFTSVYDAVGMGINNISNRIEQIVEKSKENKELLHQIPSKKIVIIITDGDDNRSVEFNNLTIRELIKKKETEGWNFIYFGANLDAIKAAEDIGINTRSVSNFTRNYDNNSQGLGGAYQAMSYSVSNYRSNNVSDIVPEIFTTTDATFLKSNNGLTNKEQQKFSAEII